MTFICAGSQAISLGLIQYQQLLRDYKLIKQRDAEECYELINLPSMAEKRKVDERFDFNLEFIGPFLLYAVGIACIICMWLAAYWQ